MFENETRKRLFENFLSLSVLQIASYILPLITLPYLVRVLGPAKFGLIAFSQAFIGYFNILTDYGFNLSATREISINRDNKEKVSEIFSSVMVIKFSLLLVSLVIMSVIVFSFEKFRQDWLICYLAFGIILGQTLFPVWLFQGMERMKYITFLNILSRLIFTVAIFVFIRHTSDYVYVPLLNSLGAIIAGLLAMWVVFRNFNLGFKMPSFANIKYHLKEGWYIFISTAAISLYTTSNVFILGLFTNNTIVGYYSAAEKIIRAVQGLLGPISQTIYPYISKLYVESRELALNLLKKLIKITGITYFFISTIMIVFAKEIVFFLYGTSFEDSVIIFRILSLIPFILSLSTIYATLFLLGFGYKKIWSNIIITAGLIQILLDIILVYIFSMSAIGISLAVVITELYILYNVPINQYRIFGIFIPSKNSVLIYGYIIFL